MDLFSITYRSVTVYFIGLAGGGYLGFDAGWPGSFREYRDALKAAGHRPDGLRILLVSHYHIDHAGLAGELQSRGARLAAFPAQLPDIDPMEELIARKGYPYVKVDRERIERLDPGESRGWLASLGISGQALQADGHGPGHYCLALEVGVALTGDLAPERMAGENDQATARNWAALRALGVRRALPAHGGPQELD
jgi:glyoxylase-like metal-dependent hydrolase (beta-lactamase superfamily II)